LTVRCGVPSIAAMMARPNTRTAALAGLFAIFISACSWYPRPEVSVSEPAAPAPRFALGQSSSVIPGSEQSASTNKAGTADLWGKIAIELSMAAKPAQRVANPLSLFGNRPAFVVNAAARAEPYLKHIYGEIEKRELPFELALIPIIESAFNPAATSPSGAAGIWQFMPATGHRFGLKQSRWYDGRRDLLASTTAALDYFEELRDRFMGDWELIFAAYNCGERTVERAIERNAARGLSTEFHALELPRSTQEYVPKLLALVEILAHPEAYDVVLPAISDKDYFEIVDVGGEMDLNHVLDWSGMSAAEFDALNSGFRKRYTSVDTPTLVLIPVEHAGAVVAGLATLAPGERGRRREYTVSAGDTLSHIANATGVPVVAIRSANRLKSSRLSVGQKLVLPGPAEIRTLHTQRAAKKSTPATVHVVRAGDNLWDLARHYKTSVAEITRLNDISRNTTLRLGQKLAVGASQERAIKHADDSRPTTGTQHYTVKDGDSLWTISRRFQISVAKLKRWNDLSGHALQPGQSLVVRQLQPPATDQDG